MGQVAQERQIKCRLDLRLSKLMNEAAEPTIVRADEQLWNEHFALIYVDDAGVFGLKDIGSKGYGRSVPTLTPARSSNP